MIFFILFTAIITFLDATGWLVTPSIVSLLYYDNKTINNTTKAKETKDTPIVPDMTSSEDSTAVTVVPTSSVSGIPTISEKEGSRIANELLNEILDGDKNE